VRGPPGVVPGVTMGLSSEKIVELVRCSRELIERGERDAQVRIAHIVILDDDYSPTEPTYVERLTILGRGKIVNYSPLTIGTLDLFTLEKPWDAK
jgi:hypothetical protein